MLEFWNNLAGGVESITILRDEERERSWDAASPDGSTYVSAAALVEDADQFDAEFFQFTPREAEFTDPQQRLFLECAWEALESAGCDPRRYQGLIGVYGGSSPSSYVFNLYMNPEAAASAGAAQIGLGNNTDFLTTLVSYKLGLKGPSVGIQTACSTSLVSVHLACEALLHGECDVALAGGVSVRVPLRSGYYYREGGILSPDGHCRAFDKAARGTIFGSGAGVVVLKRLDDALAEGDSIRAVIRGSAINNDGATKVGFTAPSVEGQTEVIIEALENSGIPAATIGYVEAHGTGTVLGDPIEISALTAAYRLTTAARGFCPIGSVKTNVGHLDAAAGVAGLIKTVLALEKRLIPPSLHFSQPNPRIDFDSSPFFVNTTLRRWESKGVPRRAGVSSLGIGGTNAHVVLEETPALDPTDRARPWQLLILSARTQSALDTSTRNLATQLSDNPGAPIADVAYTLQLGRRAFDYRRMLVCSGSADAGRALGELDRTRVLTSCADENNRRTVVFMFPGQGAQYTGMGAELYRLEPVFRTEVDRCAGLLAPHLGFNLAEVLFAPPGDAAHAADLDQTVITQPALFTIEYSLAQLLISWGIKPESMIGHSIGEYVAACVAGVLSLEDALRLVAVRGRLVQESDRGSMLNVLLPEEELLPLLSSDVALAAVNGSSGCVLSGQTAAIAALESRLKAAGVECQPLRVSHAFHSAKMEPVMAPFLQEVQRVSFRRPDIGYISNVTGTWIGSDVVEPVYWVRHLRGTVRFGDGIAELTREPNRIFLEVGPGHVLSSLVRRERHGSEPKLDVIATMRDSRDARSDWATLLSAVGKLWLAGGEVEWARLHSGEKRRRVSLPTYPFERQRYWINPNAAFDVQHYRDPEVRKAKDTAEWFYVPSWKRSVVYEPDGHGEHLERSGWWLLFVGKGSLNERLLERLSAIGQKYVVVSSGAGFLKVDDRSFEIAPDRASDYQRLLRELRGAGKTPERVVHLWSTGDAPAAESSLDPGEMYRGFYSLLFLAQALSAVKLIEPLKLVLVTNNLHQVTGDEQPVPERAMALGPMKVIPQEHTHIRCQSIDLASPAEHDEAAVEYMLGELFSGAGDHVVAYRGRHRWVQTFERVPPPTSRTAAAVPLRPGGVYVIVGGFGRFGLMIAGYLARTFQANLVLVGRTGVSADDGGVPSSDVDRRRSAQWRMTKVQELEALGATVQVAQADIAERSQLAAAFDSAVARFGAIHGVIHAAGLQEHRFIDALTVPDCERMFRSKVDGLLTLEQILRDRPIDFCVTTSSLSPMLGGLGFAAYAAANLFMDAFVLRLRQQRRAPWRIINWEGWPPLGSGDADMSQKPARSRGGISDYFMSDEEVIACFQRALTGPRAAQLVIATADLNRRIDQWVKLERVAAVDTQPPAQGRGSRKLKGEFVAPRDEVERTIADVGRSVLGIEAIGVFDNFFEMGGSSLLAVQLMARLREVLKQQIPLKVFFERPTVAGLAEFVRTDAAENLQELDELLAQVEQLDDEQIRMRLAAEIRGDSRS